MKHARKIYQAPRLKALRLGRALMFNNESKIASGGNATQQVEVDSKAFWGGSLFDDEDEEIIDEPY